MDIKLQNSWEYKDDDWWDWSAYLTGSDLPKVDHVEYILHPTFQQPLRTIVDPTEGFKLDSAGWGAFKLKALAHMKDGQKILLSRDMRLDYEPKKGNTENKD